MLKVMDPVDDMSIKELKDKDPEEYEARTLSMFMENIGGVAVDTVIRSYPGLDQDEAEALVLKNMQEFMNMIFSQVNTVMESDDKRKISKLRHIQKKVEKEENNKGKEDGKSK